MRSVSNLSELSQYRSDSRGCWINRRNDIPGVEGSRQSSQFQTDSRRVCFHARKRTKRGREGCSRRFSGFHRLRLYRGTRLDKRSFQSRKLETRCWCSRREDGLHRHSSREKHANGLTWSTRDAVREWRGYLGLLRQSSFYCPKTGPLHTHSFV